MKILHVRFKNLNSLMGEWNIDFTDPVYSEDGIFAITGPTGSGKTTILDAICLALYGRTPRLDSISASSNEIMSRQTGDCFSEVVFSIGSARYRSRWSQRKARGKAEGKLQSATREFVDDKTNTVLEEKLKTVTAAVIEKTGMTFEQFTRSMLLAQGGFAAFLQAPADERAPILEQITGTEIYSRISVKVHEMRGEQRGLLEKLQAAHGSIRVLSDDETAALIQQVAEQESVKKAVAERKDKAQASLRWLDQVAALEDELEELDQRWIEFEKRRTAFGADKQRVELAEKARVLQVDWAQLSSARNQARQDAATLAGASEQLPELEKEFAAAQRARDAARTNLDQLRAGQKNAALTIKAVRELDLHIVAQQKLVQAAKTDMRVLTEKIAEADKRRDTLGAQIKAESESVQQAADYLSAHVADASLPENLAALREKSNDLNARFSMQKQVAEKATDARAEFDKLVEILEEKTAAYEQHKVIVHAANQKMADANAALDDLLHGGELDQIQKELDESRTRNRLLVDLQAGQRELSSTELEISAKRAEKAEMKLSLGKREADLILAETDRDHCEEHLHSAEIQLELIRRMADMEEQRRLLMEGHPCPLCGSTEHPYALGNIVQPTKAEAQVSEAKNRFEKAQVAVVAVEKRLLLIGQSGQQIRTRIAELKERRSAQQMEVAALCAQLDLAVKDVRIKAVNGLLAESTRQMRECVARVEAVNQAAKEQTTARTECDVVQAAFHQSETALAEATTSVEKQRLLCDQAQARRLELMAEMEGLKSAFLGQLAVYGINELSGDVLDRLKTRSDAWKTAQETATQGTLALKGLQIELDHVRSLLAESGALLADEKHKKAALKTTLAEQQQARINLFEDKEADAEEFAWTQRVDDAERAQDRTGQTFVELDKRREMLIVQIDSLTRTQAERAVSIVQQEQAFSSEIKSRGFADESQYQAALLAESEYAVLVEAAESLKKEATEIASLRKNKTVQLDADRAKNMTDQPREAIAVALQLSLDEESSVSEKIGGFRQQLADDAEARSRSAGQLEAIALQQKIVDRWDRLHALIGSGDGKKFRNFAQGLTFELVIAQANRQLQKMSDRYVLTHDGKQPLDLNIIDDYQGGEERSTKNLSGGESFIVSLALALGLAHMASRNVRVDSLFLDEGFATLDEDALEIALDTLAGLKEEGKLIGVISHVPQLKERIRTQIQIEPQAGGRSVICGAGIGLI